MPPRRPRDARRKLVAGAAPDTVFGIDADRPNPVSFIGPLF